MLGYGIYSLHGVIFLQQATEEYIKKKDWSEVEPDKVRGCGLCK